MTELDNLIGLLKEYTEKLRELALLDLDSASKMHQLSGVFSDSSTSLAKSRSQAAERWIPKAAELARYASRCIENKSADGLKRLELQLRLAELEGVLMLPQFEALTR